MLLKEKTLNSFGIDVDTLSKSSHKKVFCTCDYCGSEYLVQMKNRTNGYKKFPKDACKSCRYKKREEVSLTLHGVKNPAQRKDVREKITSVSVEDNIEEIRRMAGEGFSKSFICTKLSIPRSSLDTYLQDNDCDINFESDRSKVFKKALRHGLGEDYADVLADRLKSNSQKKYGVDNYFQAEEIKEKSRQTNVRKYGEEYWIQVNENKLTAKEKEIQSKIDSGQIRLYKGMRLHDACKYLDISTSHFISLYNNVGLDETFKFTKNETQIEKRLKKFLCEKGLTFEYNKFFHGKYPDFLVNNVVIECDGLYWHSDKFQKNNNYHYDKMVFYKALNLKPLFFRSDEIECRFPIVCSIILNALGMNKNKLFARKLNVRFVTNKEAYDFCEENHLMGGFKNGSRSIALFDGDRMVSVFQVKSLKKSSGKYDLSRYCTVPDTSIVGGFSKMLKFFERNCAPSYLQTFVDLRYGCGDYLEGFGFKEKSCHTSFQWTNGTKTFHRMNFRGNSGYENGLHKIWDCGQKKMVKTFCV